MAGSERDSDESEFTSIEARAIAYAREAGRIAVSHFQKPLDITYKSKKMRNPVTGVDKEIESFLHSAIAGDFPGHGILGEEGTGITADESGFWWVLDPLDGTNNFINGLPLFAVSIGVFQRQRPVAAAIFSPVTHLGSSGVYHATSGGGAYLEEVRLEDLTSEEPTPGRLASVPGSYGYRFKLDRELRKRHGEPRVLGSIALELALTAGGVLQSAVFGSPKIWDVAAGVLLVSEAGGTVLARNPESGAWEGFGAAIPVEVDQGKQAETLRTWVRPIIAGSPGVAGYLAQHITVKTRKSRREARGRSDNNRDSEIPASG